MAQPPSTEDARFLRWARRRPPRSLRANLSSESYCNRKEVVMLNRCNLVIAGAAVAIGISAAQAQSWKSQYPELVFAKVPDENASGTMDRWTPFTNYLAKELGTKVTLRIVSDYAAVVEGQRAA